MGFSSSLSNLFEATPPWKTGRPRNSLDGYHDDLKTSVGICMETAFKGIPLAGLSFENGGIFLVFFTPRGSESHRSSVIVDTPKYLGHLDSEPTASVIICPATGYGRQVHIEEIFNATVQIHPLVSFHTSSTDIFAYSLTYSIP